MNRTAHLLACLCLSLSSTIAPAQVQYQVLHSFTGGASDGAYPYGGSLIQSGQFLYGMTTYGGSGTLGNYDNSNLGTVYRISPDGTRFSLLHSFPSGAGDGREPHGSLVQSGTTLYGMTYNGGTRGAGTIFKVNTDGTGYGLLRSFTGGVNDGGHPVDSLIKSGSVLYGMTRFGGNGYGTIFKIGENGTGFSLLHSFSGTNDDGFLPEGSLILLGSTLYGMTVDGGENNGGTIFKIQTDGTGYTRLHTFGSTDPNNGRGPFGSLIQSGTTLYGMTAAGGSKDSGTIFKIETDGTDFSLLHSFTGGDRDGSYPNGSLILSGPFLYGTTKYGGSWYDNGTVFQIRTDGTDFSLLHSFAGYANGDGATPYGSLLKIGRSLYGTTASGGIGAGTIFRLEIPEPSSVTLVALLVGSCGPVRRRTLPAN